MRKNDYTIIRCSFYDNHWYLNIPEIKLIPFFFFNISFLISTFERTIGIQFLKKTNDAILQIYLTKEFFEKKW